MKTLVAARAVYCLETPRRSPSAALCSELARPRRTERWRPDPRTVARLRLQALSRRELVEKAEGELTDASPVSLPNGAQGVRGANFELASPVRPVVIRATRMTISTKPRKIEGILARLLSWLVHPQVLIEG
jgi:hypothetical protein